MIRTTFSPVQHGFKFRNDFSNHVLSIPLLGINFDTQGCGGMAFVALDLKELSAPEVYFAENGNLRRVPNPAEFDVRGFFWTNVGIVPDGGLRIFQKGHL